jgi:hypothetical protein
MSSLAQRAFVFIGLFTIGCSPTSSENPKGMPELVSQEIAEKKWAQQIKELWKPSSYYSAIHEAFGVILDEMKINGVLGSSLHYSSEECRAEYVGDKLILCTPAEADRIIQQVHGDIMKFIEKKNFVVEGDRELSTKDRLFHFELRYIQGDNEGFVSVSAVPTKDEGYSFGDPRRKTFSWDGEKAVRCALTIQVKESAKTK